MQDDQDIGGSYLLRYSSTPYPLWRVSTVAKGPLLHPSNQSQNKVYKKRKKKQVGEQQSLSTVLPSML